MAQPFGGVTYNFEGQEDSMEKIFGDQDLPPTEVFKIFWAYVKEKGLKVPKA